MGGAISPITAAHNWHAGESTAILIRVKDEVTSIPIDLLGWDIIWVLKESDIGPILVTKTLSDGLSIQNGLGIRDEARILMQSSDTLGLPAGIYYHVFFRDDGEDNTFVMAEGTAVLHDVNLGE